MGPLIVLLLGLAVAAAVVLISGGHMIFLPLFIILPLGLFGFGRRHSAVFRRVLLTRRRARGRRLCR